VVKEGWLEMEEEVVILVNIMKMKLQMKKNNSIPQPPHCHQLLKNDNIVNSGHRVDYDLLIVNLLTLLILPKEDVAYWVVDYIERTI
jgi:hypothetical protein